MSTLADKARLIREIKRVQGVVAQLKARGVATDVCARCHTEDWTVEFLEIAARTAPDIAPVAPVISPIPPPPGFDAPPNDPIAPPPSGGLAAAWRRNLESTTVFIPVVSIVCSNCGYTVFHNTKVLEAPKKPR